jgi:cytochrome P450
MTEEEIISNLFVYAFAGNDTTAIALTSILYHLAANPQSQEWIAEELQYYLTSSDTSTWSFENFKKLKRCGAVIVSAIPILPITENMLNIHRWKPYESATPFPNSSKQQVQPPSP